MTRICAGAVLCMSVALCVQLLIVLLAAHYRFLSEATVISILESPEDSLCPPHYPSTPAIAIVKLKCVNYTIPFPFSLPLSPLTAWQGHGCGWGWAHIATSQYIACPDCKLVVVERNNIFRDVLPEASITKHQTTHFQHAYWHDRRCNVNILLVEDDWCEWSVVIKRRCPLEGQPAGPSGKHHDIYGWVRYLCEV